LSIYTVHHTASLSSLEDSSAFLVVQLQRLEPRVISHARIKGKERLLFCRVLCWAHRMWVMQALPQDVAYLACVPLPEQAASAFLIVQLRSLAPRVISQSGQKVKEQPSVLLVLCLSGLTKAFPHFYVTSIQFTLKKEPFASLKGSGFMRLIFSEACLSTVLGAFCAASLT
jgi:hypothetical protein